MLADANVVAEVPEDWHPRIVLDPVAVEVTVQIEFRNLAVGTVPFGKSTPIRFTFDEDDMLAVKFSTRQLEPIVRSVVLEVQFNCWITTAWGPAPFTETLAGTTSFSV